MIYFAAYLVRSGFVTFSQVWLVLAGGAWLAAILCAIVIPDQDEYFDEGERALGIRREAEPLRILHGIRDGANLFMQHAFHNTIFVVGAAVVYLLEVYYMGTVFQYLSFQVSVMFLLL